MPCAKCGYIDPKKPRSKKQNKSYWKVCVEPLTDYLKPQGYTASDVHELLKSECNYEIKFLRDRHGNITEKRIPLSTTGLTTVQFNEFMEKIRKYASELGCFLYEPNEAPINE